MLQRPLDRTMISLAVGILCGIGIAVVVGDGDLSIDVGDVAVRIHGEESFGYGYQAGFIVGSAGRGR